MKEVKFFKGEPKPYMRNQPNWGFKPVKSQDLIKSGVSLAVGMAALGIGLSLLSD